MTIQESILVGILSIAILIYYGWLIKVSNNTNPSGIRRTTFKPPPPPPVPDPIPEDKQIAIKLLEEVRDTAKHSIALGDCNTYYKNRVNLANKALRYLRTEK